MRRGWLILAGFLGYGCDLDFVSIASPGDPVAAFINIEITDTVPTSIRGGASLRLGESVSNDPRVAIDPRLVVLGRVVEPTVEFSTGGFNYEFDFPSDSMADTVSVLLPVVAGTAHPPTISEPTVTRASSDQILLPPDSSLHLELANIASTSSAASDRWTLEIRSDSGSGGFRAFTASGLPPLVITVPRVWLTDIDGPTFTTTLEVVRRLEYQNDIGDYVATVQLIVSIRWSVLLTALGGS